MSQPTAAELRRNILNTAPIVAPVAGFWPRVSAHAIDGTAVIVVSFLFNLLTARLNLPSDTVWAINIVGYVMISGSYFVMQESSLHQATFGKRCLGLRVVTSNSLQTLSQGQALARNLYKIGLGIPIVNFIAQIFSLSCFLVPFTRMKQSGADLLSGSIVLAGPKPRLYAQYEKAWMLGVFALIVGLPILAVALGYGTQENLAGLLGRTAEDTAANMERKPQAAAKRPEKVADLFPASSGPNSSARNPLDDIEAQLQRTLDRKPRSK